MKAYVEFDFYKDVYLGELITAEKDFIRMERKATAFLDEITLGKIKDVIEPVKLAVCEIAEIEYREYKQNSEDQVVSETVGPHSVSYLKKDKSKADYQKEKISVVRTYLVGTSLLYRGLPTCSS